MKLLKFLVLSFGIVLALSLFSTSAFASESSSNENEEIIDESNSEENLNDEVQPYSSLYYINFNLGSVGAGYGSWTNGVSGPGPGTVSLSKSVTVSNTYSGTLSASKKDISASVGFNISDSKTTTASYSIAVPNGKKYMIQWRPVYKKYKVEQNAYIGSTFMETTYVFPLKYDYLEYRYIEQ